MNENMLYSGTFVVQCLYSWKLDADDMRHLCSLFWEPLLHPCMHQQLIHQLNTCHDNAGLHELARGSWASQLNFKPKE